MSDDDDDEHKKLIPLTVEFALPATTWINTFDVIANPWDGTRPPPHHPPHHRDRHPPTCLRFPPPGPELTQLGKEEATELLVRLNAAIAALTAYQRVFTAHYADLPQYRMQRRDEVT